MTALILRVRRRPYVILGLIGLSLVVLVFTAETALQPTRWAGSLSWQVATGTALLAAILYQWVLLWVRDRKAPARKQRKHYTAHRWVGVATTLLFAVHAVRFGHAWTSVLAVTFIAVAATGLLNREVIPYRSSWLYHLWLWVHIALASALLPLIAVHVWIALSYQ
ncbi:hypothetical protein PGB28_01515 [Primorskyibacter aestuariivivens]|uniref:hypothetical protein n=1 Tax=Primorskyibacter aestuariivivens TaxID=1888912 RepID=UPI00230052B3|nr:hypothetical protein [Primorskyibacter aestuariivivens]MDA7427120.1 hypothetical protein [Primorskyibacter aestuariivivens]